MLGTKLDYGPLATDIQNALVGAERRWPGHVDTLCCGTLGSIDVKGECRHRPRSADHSSPSTVNIILHLGTRQLSIISYSVYHA